MAPDGRHSRSTRAGPDEPPTLPIAAVIAVGLMLVLAGWASDQDPGWRPGADPLGDRWPAGRLRVKGVRAAVASPVMTVGLAVLLYLHPAVRAARPEPRPIRIRPTLQVTIALLGLMVALELLVVLAAIGSPVDTSLVLGVAPGCCSWSSATSWARSGANFVFGVRTPWTLSSDLAWNKTHRLVGRLFVLLGLAMIVVGLVGGTTAFFVVTARRDRGRARRRVRLLLSGLEVGPRPAHGRRTDVTGIDARLVVLIVPLVLLELGLTIWALWDLTRPGRRVRGESRLMWGADRPLLLGTRADPLLRGRSAGRDERVRATIGLADGRTPGTGLAGPSLGAGRAACGLGRLRRGLAADRSGLAGRPRSPAVGSRNAIRAASSPSTGSISTFPPARSSASSDRTARARRPRCECSSGWPIRPAARAPSAVSRSATAVDGRIGFLDQDPRYYGWLTGRELVELVGRLHGLAGPALATRVAEVLAQVGLADAADRRIGTYSGGMRQRLGIAQALVDRPPVLILDEPVSSLDPEGRRDLLALIAELRTTATVLFSTHVLADVERVCDRIAILDHGRLVVEGPLAGILDRYALPIYRVDPEPGQAPAVDRLVATLRAAAWVTDIGVDHGQVRVTVERPGPGQPGAPPRDRCRRAGRGRRRARPTDPRGRLPPADRIPSGRGRAHDAGCA